MKKSVLIIGGGISGLAAARELARHDVEVTLLEAKDRCGGRIHTVRQGDLPIELGAEFVHGESKPLGELLREAKVFTPEVSERNQLFENGKFSTVNLWEIVENVLHQIDPEAPDRSCEEFLATDASEPARTYTRHFVQGFHAANPQRIGTHALYHNQRSADAMNGSSQLRVAEGYSALVDLLEREVALAGGTIHKNARVRKILWKPGGVEVSAEQLIGGVSPEPKEFASVPPIGDKPEWRTGKFAAEAAIITLPLGILKSNDVQFEPPLTAKLNVARQMEFGNVVRVTFVFREAFWDDFGFVHAFNEPIPTWWSNALKPILVGWAGGPKADALLNRTHKQVESLGLEILGRILGNQATALRKQFVASHYWNWADDPFIRGAYSYIPVGGLELPKQLAEPVADALFFAGEATVSDAQTGTVFGALETGLRAARECLA